MRRKMENLELLNDHYKDSFGLLKNEQSNRNRLFICLCVVIIIHFFLIVNSNSLMTIFINLLKNTYNVDISNQINLVQNLLWFILLYFTMRYYQSNIYIERQYKYIHKIEEDISKFSKIEFYRESKNYLNYYPLILDFIHIIYTWIFPLFFEIVITSRIINEYYSYSYVNMKIFLIIDFIIFLCCFALTILYIIAMHKKISKNK